MLIFIKIIAKNKKLDEMNRELNKTSSQSVYLANAYVKLTSRVNNLNKEVQTKCKEICDLKSDNL